MPSRASRFRARAYEVVEHRFQKVALRIGWNVARPTFVCAKLTRGCNSHCSHCNLWREGPYKDELSTEEWKGFFAQLRDWLGTVRVVITGGEALSRSDGLEIITHAAGCGLLVNLCSNGLAIDSTTAHKIMEADLDLLTVSLDGLRPEAHDYTRGTPGACFRVLEALEHLRSARAETGANTRIAITTVVMQQTLDGLLDIVAWATERGFLCRFQPIEQNYGECPDPAWYKSSPRWIQDPDSACRTIDRLIELRKSGAPIMTSQQDLEAMKVYFTRPESVMQKVQAHEALDEVRVCPHAVGNFVVEGNGDVRWCFQMPPAGNVKQDSAASIWRNRKRCWTAPCPWR